MKKFQYKNNNMKRIILIFLGLFSLAYGQFSNTGAKTRFVNGISLGTKLDGYYNSADSNAIYWRADSVLRAKYRGLARSLAFQGDTTGFGSRFIYNQFGSNLSAQTAKLRITDSGWANILITDSHLRSDSIRSADLRISGQLTMNNAEAIVMKRTNGLGSSVLQMTAADTIAIGNQTQGTVLYGSNPLKFVSGTNRQEMPNLSGTVALIGAANVGSFEVTNQIIGTSANFTGAVTGGNIAGTNVTAANDITGNDGVFSDSITTNTLNATGKISTTDSIVGANGRFTGTINATGQITSLSPIVSTSRSVGTTAFQAQMSTSALNDSLVVLLGRSANGTYNLMELMQYQRAANASTGGVSLNIFDAGGKQRIQTWERDSVVFNRPLKIPSVISPLRVNTTSVQLGANETSAFYNNNNSFAVSAVTTAGAVAAAIGAWNTATSGDNKFIEFYTEGSPTSRGSITYNRGSGVTAYNTTSDYRAKRDEQPINNALGMVMSLKPKSYFMLDGTRRTNGFFAHELQQVIPQAVTGTKDAVDSTGKPIYQQVDLSQIIPILTKAFQEEHAERLKLEARIAKLEELIKLIKP